MKKNDRNIIDPYNRRIDYLRISITDRCNLNCMYCVPHDRISKLSHGDILTYEEILRLVRIGVELGIRKVRITGGEPLVRKGVCEFLKKLTAMEGIEDVSLTTNGVYLKDNIDRILAAGIRRLNISLDTLQRARFEKITGHDAFHRVWDGIQSAYAAGIAPIKLNTVALRGINDDEILDFAKLTFKYPFHVRFIEHMAIGNSSAAAENRILTPDMKERIETIGTLRHVARQPYDGPAEVFRIESARGYIGFISALSHHFCHQCNRLRLTASGKIRPCLLSDYEADIKEPLRSGYADDVLAGIILKAIGNKGREHHITENSADRVETQMSTIGG